MPFVRRDILETLVTIGAQMSNVCFNWKQPASPRTITEADREMLNSLQTQWDEAVRKLRSNP